MYKQQQHCSSSSNNNRTLLYLALCIILVNFNKKFALPSNVSTFSCFTNLIIGFDHLLILVLNTSTRWWLWHRCSAKHQHCGYTAIAYTTKLRIHQYCTNTSISKHRHCTNTSIAQTLVSIAHTSIADTLALRKQQHCVYNIIAHTAALCKRQHFETPALCIHWSALRIPAFRIL